MNQGILFQFTSVKVILLVWKTYVQNLFYRICLKNVYNNNNQGDMGSLDVKRAFIICDTLPVLESFNATSLYD